MLNAMEPFDSGKAWARKRGYTVPLYDSTGRRESYMPLVTGGEFRVPRIPRTYILDRNGIVVHAELESNLFWSQFRKPLQDLMRTLPAKLSEKHTFSGEGANIDTEITEGNPHATLRIQVTAKDDLHLVARKGIKLSPIDPEAAIWVTPMPVFRQGEVDYFAAPREFTLSFIPASKARDIRLKIEYAYCRAMTECLVTEEAINIHR
ncbi:MAG TPA: hypothetical protein VLM91_04060 [Candidatus Methylomirabilis sp.]|nr:hypothetical protein [Candidatus Methylomirabilis sp.]